MLKRSEVDEREEGGLAGLLKRARRRIHPEARCLGPYLRFPLRFGKAVTQDEIAEAIGISRNWYQMLETREGLRVSPTVLGRIADALALDASERAAMFEAAVPELRSTKLKPAAYQLLETYRSLRLLGQKLWTATTEEEALTAVREYGSAHFAADLFVTRARHEGGCWGDHHGIGKPDALKRLASFDSFARAYYDFQTIDEIQHATILVQPGDVLARADERFPLREKFGLVLDLADLHDFEFLTARVRSRLGFVASIGAVHTALHEYSDVEREHMSAIAQLISHALSGSV